MEAIELITFIATVANTVAMVWIFVYQQQKAGE